MTIKKILIIFLSLMLAISCSYKNVNDPLQTEEENVGGGGHLNDYGNGDLIANGSDDTTSISTFINKYAGIYYLDGQVKYKLKDGKLYENTGWDFTEIKSGIIVEPNGIKMQISNLGSEGKIEVLNFKKDGIGKDGLSSYSSYILVKDATVDTSMNKIGQVASLTNYSGTFKENGVKFLSIDESGNVYFKKAINGSGRVYMDNGNLVIVDDNIKNVVKFKEENFVYKKYARSGNTDITVYSCSVTTDFIDDLGKTKYTGGSMTVEFNNFSVYGGDAKDYAGGIQISGNGYSKERVAKNAILKGNIITVFESKYKVRFTLTFNGDKSIVTYSKGDSTITLNKQ